MPRAQDLTKNWLWYAIRTSDCTPLDLGAYPASIYDGQPVPWPEWACKAPYGGIHASASVSPIHLKIAERPNEKDEISWTCDFAVQLVAGRWIDSLSDLHEEENVALGEIYLDGKVVEDWFTITEIRPPHLVTNRGRTSKCSHCGYSHTVVRGMH